MIPMTWLIGLGIAGIVVLAIGAWALLRGGSDTQDLGTISGQWIAEHRSHERESDRR